MTPHTQGDASVTPQDYYDIACSYAGREAWDKAAFFFIWASGEAGTKVHFDSMVGLALSRLKQKQFPEAATHLNYALENAPALDPFAFNVSGQLQEALGQWVLAETEFKTAIALQGDKPAFRINLAHLYQVLGRFKESQAEYEAVIKLDPTNMEARFYRSMTLLTQSQFVEGFREYETRYALIPMPLPMNGKPIWRGEESLDGKTILICAEQGIGDAVMCVRYARWLKAAKGAATVIVLARPEIAKLLEYVNAVAFCVSDPADAEPYDCYAPMMSLPGLSLQEDGQPWYGAGDYLRVPRKKEFNLSITEALKVGYCHAGNPLHGNDRFRSVSYEAFRPLINTPNTLAVNLQHNVIHDLMLNPKLDSVLALAQQIQELDLVITVDTSIAHIAGSMGVETWMLVPPGVDWRWGQESEETPWYQSLRIFRAKKPLDWTEVIQDMQFVLEDQ